MTAALARSGKRPWRRWFHSPAADVIKYLVVIGLVIWFFSRGTTQVGYHWQWFQVPKYLYKIVNGEFVAGPLLEGLWMTLKISGVSLVLAFAFGLIAALFRLSHSFIAQVLARVYMETIRNTPLLIQIFFIYFVLGPVLGLDRYTSGILALSLFEGAYASEIFRAGIVSIHKGQWEAAYSLGLSPYQEYRHIIMPQALRRILPPLTGQAVSLVKDSALVSVIAITDLTLAGQALISETFLTFELWFTVAAMYLVVTVILSLLVNWMEQRFKSAI